MLNELLRMFCCFIVGHRTVVENFYLQFGGECDPPRWRETRGAHCKRCGKVYAWQVEDLNDGE